MRERPILFSAPMVRAILDSRKTQTRRVVKPQPVADSSFRSGFYVSRPGDRKQRRTSTDAPSSLLGELCPYGEAGDRLWARETFAQWRTPDLLSGRPIDVTAFRAGRQWRNVNCKEHAPGAVFWEQDEKPPSVKWKPSIHMPRLASRITLEVTHVRVERLQAISESDSLAEGIVDLSTGEFGLPNWSRGFGSARLALAHLWESINGPGSWAANPWVWCVEFRKVTP